ncbi:hypothetical protein pb186bvf_015112 [Paramecium bursaria]
MEKCYLCYIIIDIILIYNYNSNKYYMQIKRGKSPLYKQSGFSPLMKPGSFSNPNELKKIHRKSYQGEALTPQLFETKQSVPILQKSHSASKLVISHRDPKQFRHEHLTELSQKLVHELLEFQGQLEILQYSDLQEWAKGLIQKLNVVKTSLEGKENFESEVVSNIQSDILSKLQKELNEEKKERYRIEEEATNQITFQEIEIDKLEKQLKQLEES